MRAMVPSTVVAMAAAAAAWVAPAVASAQVPVARVVLYEVSESLKLTGGRALPSGTTDDSDNDGDREEERGRRHIVRNAESLARLAHAALLSNNVQPFDLSTVFASAQYMTGTAVSNVSLNPTSPAFGTGVIRGSFDLAVLQDLSGNGQKLLSNLVIVNSGQLRGTLDLRAALDPTHPQPIAPVGGQWNLTSSRRTGGSFSGVFLIPFQLPPNLAAFLNVKGVNFYLNPPELEVGGTICVSGVVIIPSKWGITTLPPLCMLSADEQVLQFPLTKAVIFLYGGR